MLNLTAPAVILGESVFLGHIAQGNLPRQHRQRPITAQHLYNFERLQNIQKLLKETEKILMQKGTKTKAEILGIFDGKISRQLFGGTYPSGLHDLLEKKLGVVVEGNKVPGCYTLTDPNTEQQQFDVQSTRFRKGVLKIPLDYAPWVLVSESGKAITSKEIEDILNVEKLFRQEKVRQV